MTVTIFFMVIPPLIKCLITEHPVLGRYLKQKNKIISDQPSQ